MKDEEEHQGGIKVKGYAIRRSPRALVSNPVVIKATFLRNRPDLDVWSRNRKQSLSSVQSRAAAPALVKAKEKNKNVVTTLSFDWEPDHAPELRNSFEDSEGQLWGSMESA